MATSRLLHAALIGALAAALACSGSDQTSSAAPGTEGGACVGGDLCDHGLACVGGVCEPGPGGRDTSGWPTSSRDDGSGAPGGGTATSGRDGSGGGSAGVDGGGTVDTTTDGGAGGTTSTGGASATGGSNVGGGASTGGSGGAGGAGAAGTPGGTGGLGGVDAGVCVGMPKLPGGSCAPTACLCAANDRCYESSIAVGCCSGSCD